MSITELIRESRATLFEARVVSQTAGETIVAVPGLEIESLACLPLVTSASPPPALEAGDPVLVWVTSPEAEKGILLGRVGLREEPAVEESSPAAEDHEEMPDEVVIEAKKNLTFKCGEGSITLRADGKVLIRGKDLVSRARRMNRIKGGAVSIN